MEIERQVVYGCRNSSCRFLASPVWIFLAALLCLFACGVEAHAQGVTNQWTGNLDHRWFEDANWSAGIPAAGQIVRIDDTQATDYPNVLLDDATPWLSAIIVSNRTLTFSNWTTTLYATNVTVAAGGSLELPPAFEEGQSSNRIAIMCSNMTLENGGMLDGTGRGYAGGDLSDGHGPGKGLAGSRGSGAGYGGVGGDGVAGFSFTICAGGAIYGSVAAPDAPGSGGGAFGGAGSLGGHGGGAVRIEADGDLIVNGSILVDGIGRGSYGGGGSGGSIWIRCQRFGGTGLLSANGGSGNNGGGGGAGGRIAVEYTDTIGTPSVVKRSLAGSGVHSGWFQRTAPPPVMPPRMGSVWLSRADLLSTTLTNLSGYLSVAGLSAWSPASLTVRSATLGLRDAFTLDVAGELRIEEGGTLVLGEGSTLACGSACVLDNGGLVLDRAAGMSVATDLVLTNAGTLYVASGPTNETASGGLDVQVDGGLILSSGSWVYPISDLTNGGAPRFVVGTLQVDAGAGFDADGRGFRYGHVSGTGDGNGHGPGHGRVMNVGSGAGYGGRGGWSYHSSTWRIDGGIAYGLSNAPVLPGSGGGGGSGGAGRFGGNGGGVIWIESGGPVLLDGTLRANGANGGYNSGAGSGGGILLGGFKLEGTGHLMAEGGSGDGSSGGDGGGGRIAVVAGLLTPGDYRNLITGVPAPFLSQVESVQEFAVSASAAQGTGTIGDGDAEKLPLPGTIVWLRSARRHGSMITVR